MATPKSKPIARHAVKVVDLGDALQITIGKNPEGTHTKASITSNAADPAKPLNLSFANTEGWGAITATIDGNGDVQPMTVRLNVSER